MMLRRRGAQVGLPGLHPHQLRHTFAHEWLAQGGTEGDLMRIAGWQSRPCSSATAPRPPTPAPVRLIGASPPLTGFDLTAAASAARAGSAGQGVLVADAGEQLDCTVATG
jgi:hypothetical protein